MPDSLPLSIASRERSRQAGTSAGVTAPPRDVARLLSHFGARLPRYVDARHSRDVQESRARWSILNIHGATRAREIENP